MANAALPRVHRLLALGDSYTIGEGVAEALRWPQQLVSRLGEQGARLDIADIVATTGWTTDELQTAIDARAFSPPYALVSLLVGVNNQYRGRDPENYAGEFSVLLDFAVRMAGADATRVMVLSIPDWGVTRFAAEQGVDSKQVSAEIDRFNAIARALSNERGACWVDVTGISREQGRTCLAEDGLHPSADQYSLWVDAMLPSARSILAAA
jgi:lysophospholipase L1-like esterase